jgi:hypothetical protein
MKTKIKRIPELKKLISMAKKEQQDTRTMIYEKSILEMKEELRLLKEKKNNEN